VLEGEAEAYIASGDGHRMPLGRFGPGSTFGEMALLRGEPVSAWVDAVTPARVLEVGAERFAQGLGECEPLRRAVLSTLADRLASTSRSAWSLHQRARALDSLLDRSGPGEPLVAESAHMRKVTKRITELAVGRGPVLITGEPGTGRLLVARALHEARGGGPLVVVECAALRAEDAAETLFGAACPGRAADADELQGAAQLAGRGTLVLRHVEALPASAQARVADSLAAGRDGVAAGIIATAATGLASESGAGRFDPTLARLLAAEVIAVPRLCDRKLDILPLVRLFLASRSGAAPAVARDAEHAFVSRRYRSRNAAELREAVELAADFAGGGEIRAEHIFAGPKSEAAGPELDLTGVPTIARLLRPGALLLLRAGVLAAFAAVIAFALAAPARPAGQLANAAIWAAWEPVIIVAFLFFGHLWCTVCPLSTAGLWAQRLVAIARPPPAWLKQHGIWLATVGFFAIIWLERAFHMTSRPLPSGVLLLGLMASAAAFAVIYQRETWCRYVCPLGTLAAGYALPATLQVRANPSVCATYCTEHACYKGAGGTPGCSVFHHPLFASESHLCKLCFRCLSACPHGSARLYLRPPLQAVWRLGGLSAALAPFSLSLFFLAPMVLAAQRFEALAGVAALTAAMLAALAAGAVAARTLPRLLGGDGDDALTPRVPFALMLLAWGPLMAYQLGNVGVLAQIHLRAAPGAPLAAALPDAGVTVQLGLQVAVVALALLLTAITLSRTRAWQTRQGAPPPPARWRALRLVALAYSAVAIALLLR